MIGGDFMSKKKVYVFISILLMMTLLFSGCGNSERKGSSEPAYTTTSSDSSDVSDPALAERTDLEYEYEYEYVKATLKDNVLTVTLLSGDAADQCPGSNNGLQFDKPYPVSGLADSYTDLFVGAMGNSVSPFVFLLTERGTVECVPMGDVLLVWANGNRDTDPVFSSIGELPDVSNITSFYEGSVWYDNGGYTTVFAVTADGNEIDLTFPYYYAINPQDAPPTEEMATKILMDNVHAAGLDDLLDHGLYTIGTGETENIYGDYCYLTGVGNDQTDNLGHLQFFGVASTGAVYELVGEPDRWRPSNKLAEIYSDSQDYYDLFSIICQPNGNELNEIYFTGRMEEVEVSDPLIHSDTPMVLVPLKNNMNIKVELIDFSPEGEILSETVLSDLTLSRGDLCTVYAKMMYDTSPLFIFASWQDGPSEFTAAWWAVCGGGEYGETYIEYITGYEDVTAHAMG